MKRGGVGTEYNVSAASSFIANARNELYAFYAGKGKLLKILKTIVEAPPPPSPLESVTETFAPAVTELGPCVS